MKKGFTLMETLLVIVFVSISLLLLYTPFISLINNNKKNIMYDDASNIYKTYYLKEYLKVNGLVNESLPLQEISCQDLSLSSCQSLITTLNINKMYLVTDIETLKTDDQSLNDYLLTIPKDDYSLKLIVEYLNKEEFSYVYIRW